MFSKLREPVNGLTHFAGAFLAAIGSVVLLALGGEELPRILSLIVYGLSMLALFLTSATYHSVRGTEKTTRILRKMDHSAIYLLIAGTYTPFCVIAFEGFWRWGFLSIIWGLALVGILVKVFVISAPRWVTAGVYVIMGWLSVFAVNEMLAVLAPTTIEWLVIGGITYTVGAVVYITRKLNFKPGVFGFHEVWHIFVLLGAAAHFTAVVSLLVSPL